jgi:uncharacterized protein YkwD
MRRHQLALLPFVVCLSWSACGVTGVIDPGQIPDEPALQAPDEQLPLDADEDPALPNGGGDTRAAASVAEAADAAEVTLEATPTGIIDDEELAFLKQLNAYRASKQLGKLRVSVALTRAAQAHSADMAAKGYFSHTSADGTTFAERVKRYYPYNTWTGENIAMGFDTGDRVFAAWKASAGHNANMLGANYVVIGIARVANAEGVYYWTTDFGGKRDAVLSAGFSTIASNGGFEASSVTAGVSFSKVRTLNRWHTYAASGGASSRRTGSALAGSYGLRNNDPTPGAASATQLLLGAARVSYVVSAQARRVSGPSAQILYLDFLDGNYARISVFTARAATSTSWQTVTVAAPSPTGTRYVRVIVYGSGKDGERSAFDWDSVAVKAY